MNISLGILVLIIVLWLWRQYNNITVIGSSIHSTNLMTRLLPRNCYKCAVVNNAIASVLSKLKQLSCTRDVDQQTI